LLLWRERLRKTAKWLQPYKLAWRLTAAEVAAAVNMQLWQLWQPMV
jgi:hypothetical protein